MMTQQKHRPINGWTKARMLKKLREHLPANGDWCAHKSGMCAYQNERGQRCAVGAFIPDDCIRELGSSSSNVGGLLHKYPELGPSLPLPPYLLSRLQRIHDIRDGNALDACVEWVEDNVEDDQ